MDCDRLPAITHSLAGTSCHTATLHFPPCRGRLSRRTPAQSTGRDTGQQNTPATKRMSTQYVGLRVIGAS